MFNRLCTIIINCFSVTQCWNCFLECTCASYFLCSGYLTMFLAMLKWMLIYWVLLAKWSWLLHRTAPGSNHSSRSCLLRTLHFPSGSWINTLNSIKSSGTGQTEVYLDHCPVFDSSQEKIHRYKSYSKKPCR